MMLDEDCFRISNPNACKTIGAINDVALAIIKMYQILTGRDSLKAAKMWFHSDVFKATQTLVAIKNSKEIVNTLKDALAKNKK